MGDRHTTDGRGTKSARVIVIKKTEPAKKRGN